MKLHKTKEPRKALFFIWEKNMFYYAHGDYLSHHGILGMKWGKRNGPPYPLSPSAHSASEKKAGWQDSLDGGGTKQRALAEKVSNVSVKTTKLENSRFYDDKRDERYRNDYYENTKDLSEIKQAYKQLNDARAKYVDAHKLSTEFKKLSNDQYAKYVKKAVDYFATPENLKRYGEKGQDLKSYRKEWHDGLMDRSNYHANDDVFKFFAKEKGSSFDKELKKHEKALDDYRKAQEKVVDSLIGQYGDTKLKNFNEGKVYKYGPNGLVKKPHIYENAPTVKAVINETLARMSNEEIDRLNGQFYRSYYYSDLRD